MSFTMQLSKIKPSFNFLLKSNQLFVILQLSWRPLCERHYPIYSHNLQMQYNAFNTTIRKKLTHISLEDLYSLLLIKEINITDSAKEAPSMQSQVALYIHKGKKQQQFYRRSTHNKDKSWKANTYNCVSNLQKMGATVPTNVGIG